MARLKSAGSLLFVVEHELDVMRQADWIVDVESGAGEEGGRIVASGTPNEVASSTASRTAKYPAEAL